MRMGVAMSPGSRRDASGEALQQEDQIGKRHYNDALQNGLIS